MVVDYFDYILGKLGESKTKRERFVTTDLNLVKAIRELEKKGLVQYRMKMQPAQPLGLICHDDGLNTKSDWAEKMVCQLTGAKQTAWNCKGHDGVLPDGTKIEVKCVSWASWKGKEKHQLTIRNLNPQEFDLLVVLITDNLVGISEFQYFVVPRESIEALMVEGNRIQAYADNFRWKMLLEHQCTLSELTNLKHGYDYFLKMKGKTPPVEMPKESVQFVVDVWEPNEYELMPFDWRYESPHWYFEFVVAHFLRGKITEERKEGFDVEFDGLTFQVKMANITQRKSGRNNEVTLNGIKLSSKYDIMIAVAVLTDQTIFLIMPKEIADYLKYPYHKGNLSNGRFYFTYKDGQINGAGLDRYKKFMFTIDHLAELGQIGWEAFYNKYLKEACAETLQKYGKGDH